MFSVVLGWPSRLQHSPDPGALEQSVETAIRVGYRHIDTAYSFHNETSVGAVLQRMLQSGEIKREDLFVSTKVTAPEPRSIGDDNFTNKLGQARGLREPSYLSLARVCLCECMCIDVWGGGGHFNPS